MAFYPLERLMNLCEGYQRAFKINNVDLLLVHSEGQTYLLINQCPHQKYPLTEATIRQGEVQCPFHGMRFDLKTGLSRDACRESLAYLPIAYEGSQIGVNL